MLKRRLSLIALLAAFVLVVAACGDDDATEETTATTAAPATTAATATTAAPATTEATMAPAADAGADTLACMVSDQAGIDDQSFNEKAWDGMLRAEAELGVTVEFLESNDATDYRPNIDAFLERGCDLIVTVGFQLADDTVAAHVDQPDQRFAIIDQGPGPFPPWADDDGTLKSDFRNLRGLTYRTDEATFLAGYVAAGMSESGVIGTFGGINIPPVTIFMEGFRNGAAYYDQVKGTETTVLGWDGTDGFFTQNFTSLEDGRAFGQQLLDEGADIILPVAGPVGIGTGAAIADFNAAGGNAMMLWVDADGCESTEFCDFLIGSVLKNMDNSVFETITNVVVLGSVGNQYSGNLANEGVDFIAGGIEIPEALAAEVAALKAAIAGGTQGVGFPAGEEG